MSLSPQLSGHEYLAAGYQQRNLSQTSAIGSFAPSMRSKASSNSLYQSAVLQQPTSQMNPPRGPRLRAQYPNNPRKRHVEFILVATFDIDRGPTMEHQYPSAISNDETMLAELMLPDQVHSRSQDWTIFFLHKDPEPDSETENESSPNARGEETPAKGELADGEEDEDDPFANPPLTYVLNHVNTKHDSTVQRYDELDGGDDSTPSPSEDPRLTLVRRGAVVKAMAICTRHSFLDIFKPVLVLAIEEYFKNPTVDFLANLFNSLNAMDLSLLPSLSLLEGMILKSSNSKDIFIDKFRGMIEQRQQDEGSRDAQVPQTPGETVLGDDGTRYTLPKDTHEFESKIHFSGHSVPVKVPTAKSSETVGNFSIIKLITTFSTPHSTSPQPFALHAHLTTNGAYTHPIIVLVNAILTQKRVIFLGHGRPSEDVAEAVLAACALVSGGVLRGFTRHAFPYTDLTKVDQLTQVPGFIAGVTNPIFASSHGWWDLLCDISTGRMKISSKIEPAPITDGLATFQQQNPHIVNVSMTSQSAQPQDHNGDIAFMEAVQRSIANRLGESSIRSMWREWIIKLTRIAAVFEEIVYGASALYIGGEQANAGDFGLSGHGYVWGDEATRQKELAANVCRIEGWRGTRSYYSYKQDLIYLYDSMPIKTLDLNHHHDRLRTQKLSQQEAAAVYLGFSAAVQTPAEICQLLTVTTESHGGLFYTSLGLLHPQQEVRHRTAELLERISEHEAGKHFWEGLNRFTRLAYKRVLAELEQNRTDANNGQAVTGSSPLVA